MATPPPPPPFPPPEPEKFKRGLPAFPCYCLMCTCVLAAVFLLAMLFRGPPHP